MNKQNLILLKSFLFKTFIVGIMFAVLIFVLTFCFWDKFSYIASSKFQVTQQDLGLVVINFFSILRFYLIFVILVPLIALHWLIESQK